MTTYSKTIGTGGDYSTLGAWQTARLAAAESVSGDTEEAVILDGSSTPNFTFNTGWTDGVKVRITAQNPHQGYWNVSAGGALLSATSNQSVFGITAMTASSVIIELDNLVMLGSPDLSYPRVFGINGSSINVRILNCLMRSQNSGGACLFVFGSNGPKNIYIENSVLDKAGNYAIDHPWNASSVMNLSCVGSFINGVFLGGNTAQVNNLNFKGTLLSGAYVGALTSGIAEDCIGTNAWTGWTTTHCSAATFVEGTPTAGQVGFTSFSNYDFSLVDDDNNLAKNFVLTAQMPATDIKGLSRPQGTYSDAGAFELYVQSSFQYFLPITVLA